ncbi:MAG TPA: hypothetical protein VLZ50_11675 [Terracidiphilus sp.]|nr:hypothetical protein [Terracidiphilus sp.]
MTEGTEFRKEPAGAKPRGFTNDGKVTSDIVNDSYGTVDPADSTGLEPDAEAHTGSDKRTQLSKHSKDRPARRQ